MPDSIDRLSAALADRYTIERKLGEGGMAIVYLAEDIKHRRKVALKVLRPELAASLGPDRFLREVRVTANLRHPHVLPLFDSGESDGFLYYVMPYVEGESLRERVRREGPLPIADAVKILLEVVDALAEAHKAGLVHRDIKPDNVMLSGRHAVVTDFGVAKAVSDATGRGDLTATGLALGTPAYMAPEQAMAEEHIDQRVDIYALGALGYELLSGRPPFTGKTAKQLLVAHLTEAPTPIGKLREGTPVGLNDVLMRCLAKEPADRWQTADELLGALEPYATTATGVPAGPRALSRRTRLTMLGAVAVLALLVGVGAELGPRLHRLVTSRSIPREQHLAVLPLQNVDGGASGKAFSDGIMETLTSSLTQLQQFHHTLWVVPASEVVHHDVHSPGDANKVLGVNLVVTGSVQRIGPAIRLTLNLVDAATLHQLNSAVIDIAEKDVMALQNKAAISLLQMLNLQLDSGSNEMLEAGNTESPEAYEYYAQGRGHLQHSRDANEVQQAMDAFLLAVRLDSTYAAAHAGLAQAYWARYRLDKTNEWAHKAVAEAERAYSLDDKLAYVLTTLGTIHDGTGRYAEAIRDFDRALVLNPISYEEYRGLATAYEHEGRPDEAERTYKRVIAMRPDDWIGHNSLGVFYFGHARYDEAIAEFQKVTELNPKDYLGFSNLGGAYYMKGNYDAAEAMFEKAFALGHQYTVASNLGTLYYAQGKYAEAARAYEEALRLDDRDYVLWGNLGSAYLRVPGKKQQADEAFTHAARLAEKAREINPNDAELLAALGGYYGSLGDTARARADTKKALALAPTDPSIMYRAAATYRDVATRGEAILWLARAIANGYSQAEIERQPEFKDLLTSPAFAKALAEARKSAKPKDLPHP